MTPDFEAKLKAFLKKQRGNNSAKTEAETKQFVNSEVAEYVPRERWSNVFMWMVGNALAYGIGITLAAAIIRGASGLMPEESKTTIDDLAQAVEGGFIQTPEDFINFAEGYCDLGEEPVDIIAFGEDVTPVVDVSELSNGDDALESVASFLS